MTSAQNAARLLPELPSTLLALAEAFSDHAKVANRLWLTLMGALFFVLPHRSAPTAPGGAPKNIQLPFALGEVPPDFFYLVAVAILGVLITAFCSAHSQMVRAHNLTNIAVETQREQNAMNSIDIRDVMDVLRMSSFLRVAPLAQLLYGPDHRFFHQPAPSNRRRGLAAAAYVLLKALGTLIYFGLPGGGLAVLWLRFEEDPAAKTAAGIALSLLVRSLAVAACFALALALVTEITHTLRIGRRLWTGAADVRPTMA